MLRYFRAVSRKGVDVRGAERRYAVIMQCRSLILVESADIPEAEVVTQDEDDVGARCGFRRSLESLTWTWCESETGGCRPG